MRDIEYEGSCRECSADFTGGTLDDICPDCDSDGEVTND